VHLVHLKSKNISKYVFFDPTNLSTINNESIVYQISLEVNPLELEELIKHIIGEDQFNNKSFTKCNFPPDFHGDKINESMPDEVILTLNQTYNQCIVDSFRIGANLYSRHGIGIDIHVGHTFVRKGVIKPTPKDKYGHIKNGNIEIKYRCPDPNDPQNTEKGRMINLNFHIQLSKKISLSQTIKNFDTQLITNYGKQGYYSNPRNQQYIQGLEGMSILDYDRFYGEDGATPFMVAFGESQNIYRTVLPYVTLRRDKEILETEKIQILTLFGTKIENSGDLRTFKFTENEIQDLKIKYDIKCTIQ